MKRILTLLIPVFLFACGKQEVNQKPLATFTINPVTGDHYTLFEFNGVGTTDPDGPDSLLQYRWDWESDGYYDQLYNKNPLVTHRFDQAGAYRVTLQVMDNTGEISETSQELLVDRGSRAPLEPFSPNPKDSSSNILFSGRLSWVTVDPDEDRMYYDVFLGSSMDPPLWKSEHDTTYVEVSDLVPGQKYYWKIIAYDTTGQMTEGPTWRFSIHSGNYETGQMTDNRDGQIYSTLKLGSIWWMTENLKYDMGDRSLYLNDREENLEEYGLYYKIGLPDTLVCPKGWSFPSSHVIHELEKNLGMSDDEIRIYGSYRGHDQGSQLAPGGTSGIELNYAGYCDLDGNWQLVDEAAVFGSLNTIHYPIRMIRKGYGGILAASINGIEYAPVRCIKYD